MIKIEQITDREKWDSFLKEFSPNSLLQSWGWGEFQKEYGRKVWRVGAVENGQILGVALVQLITTKLRTHLYVSNGPVLDYAMNSEAFKAILGHIKAIAIQEKVKFIRIDPLIENTKENRRILSSFNLVQAMTHTQAEHKWLLNIEGSEEEILSQMTKDTRYEIRKSEREGVVVSSSTEMKDYEEFEKVFIDTVKRHNFITHPIGYYKKQFEVLTKENMYRVYLAKKDGETIAAALISFFGDSAAYLHAGSLNTPETNKLMAPQALIWKAIKDAKEQGCKIFDFWGITTSSDPKNSWAGFTKFKKGFGGYQFDVIRAHDLPLSLQYSAISLLESTREIWGRFYKLILTNKTAKKQ